MKLSDGRITILFGDDGLRIEVRDGKASTMFARIKLNQKQSCQALSRLGHTPCKIEVYGLDKVGKKHENKTFEFEMPEKNEYLYGDPQKALAVVTVKKVCPEGWEPDLYFSSQNSFFEKNGKPWARTTIRRWV